MAQRGTTAVAMGPLIAETPGIIDARVVGFVSFFVRYCGYLGECDFRFGE
jgi:hypothetical protein